MKEEKREALPEVKECGWYGNYCDNCGGCQRVVAIEDPEEVLP